MRVKSLLLPALTACFLLSGSLAVAQPPQDGQREGRRPEARGERGPGARGPGQFPGGGAMFRPGQILPPGLVQRLALTDDQIEKLEALQKEVTEKLEGILTDEQRTQMREMAARGPQRPGGAGAGPGGRGPGAAGQGPGGRGPGPGGRERGAGGRERGAEREEGAPRERRQRAPE